MCGRFSQREAAEIYAAKMGWVSVPAADIGGGLKYNIPPGTYPMVLHQLNDKPEIERQFWGYKPHWYKRSPVINARLDTILKGSPMWKPLLSKRVIIPADGWFEWTGEKGDKQPWFIHAKNEEPIFMAGITAWDPSNEENDTYGFAIITDDSAGGMVDIHDRRPIVLTQDDAKEWLDLSMSTDKALEILSTARPEDAFRWHTVTKQIGNSKYQSSEATKLT